MIRPRVLIEDWLPIAAVGVESQRDGSAAIKPPNSRLHIWWARRPLSASRAAVLATTLPSWSANWPADLLEKFPTEEAYHNWFLHHLGVRGDPVAARARIQEANDAGVRLDKAFDGPRAFTLTPNAEGYVTQRRLLEVTWGTPDVAVADPMAGGGSIPFEALRFGYSVQANELNPVASVVLLATLRYPARFGVTLVNDLRKWGVEWADRVRARLDRFFPRQQGESIQAYIFARTVACPETGKPVPLSPNWRLRSGNDPVAVRLVCEPAAPTFGVEIVRGAGYPEYDPGVGTVRNGEGRSPWTSAILSPDYIKSEAHAGRMGHALYAIAVKNGGRSDFRAPSQVDIQALADASSELADLRSSYIAANLLPCEAIDEVSNYDRGHRYYGIEHWDQFFSPRQLLSLVAALSELRNLEEEMRREMGDERAVVVMTYLALALDKAVDYNAVLCTWETSRQVAKHVFQRHDYSFKWSYAEWDAAHNLFPWVVSQVSGAYEGIANLIEPPLALVQGAGRQTEDSLDLRQGDAASLPWDEGSVHAIVVDPPYYDNVQYAELSDFFYVWQKRSLGHIYPALFASALTDKATEAVANPARFVRFDARRARGLAKADYERKMTAAFRDMYRVLRADGVLTVMFTHKRVDAWDTLGRALIEGGFVVESSWPVHTEPEHSLHQAKKAAAASTILLTCRKRTHEGGEVWWDDVKEEVRLIARAKAKEFQAAGIAGVDLYISTFGPTLSVISRQWPVLTSDVDPATGDPLPLRPEEALDLAREEVASLRRQGLLLGRSVEFDPATDWYLLAWDAFKAAEFPFDEARKLALALDVEPEDLVAIKLISKKSGTVVLQEPKLRRRKGLADPDATSFDRLIDAAHALMTVTNEDGIRGAEAFLKRTGLASDARFRALLQALVNAVPRTRIKGEFVRPEARALDAVAPLVPDLVIPQEQVPADLPEQTSLLDDEPVEPTDDE